MSGRREHLAEPLRLLILGGTTEASALARAMAGRSDIDAVLSLAGRTQNPAVPPIPCRIGGFGGPEGLQSYLKAGRIDAVVDATHPFAARIAAHAVTATSRSDCPLAVFTRPPWQRREGDDWRSVPDLAAAALALGPRPRHVFLTSGRLGLATFRQAPQHRYLLRSIDPPAPEECPPRCDIILARGPFEPAGEEALMRRQGIDMLVSKNSGGTAGAAKLDAARALAIPVVMVERPPTRTGGPVFTDLDDVLGWIGRHRGSSSGTP